MKLFNTLTQTIEPFTTRGDEVTIYVCGITPYDTTHLGHAFTYTSIDIFIRYLEQLGLKVRYAQNVTDIDDDILRKARETGENWQELGNRWTTHFIRDLQQLNVRPPDYFPRATSVIPEIITAVQQLIEAGMAYTAGSSVYYDVASWPTFGKLSHLPQEEMLPIANERGNFPNDPHKRDPLDFVLWQAQAPDGRAGTSNARRCQPAFWEKSLTFTVAARIYASPTMTARSPKSNRCSMGALLSGTGCILPWCATKATR